MTNPQHREQTEHCSCVYSPTGNLIGQCLRCTKMVMDARNDGAQKEREHLIQAIDELIDHETTSEMEYQKDAGKNYDPNSYGRGFSAGFVASLKLLKESLEEDDVE